MERAAALRGGNRRPIEEPAAADVTVTVHPCLQEICIHGDIMTRPVHQSSRTAEMNLCSRSMAMLPASADAPIFAREEALTGPSLGSSSAAWR